MNSSMLTGNICGEVLLSVNLFQCGCESDGFFLKLLPLRECDVQNNLIGLTVLYRQCCLYVIGTQLCEKGF